MAIADSLQRALRELVAGDGAFYGSLVAAWRAEPSAEVAALIERAARLVPMYGPDRAWERRWIERARAGDPLETGTLLDQLVAHLDEHRRFWSLWASQAMPSALACLAEVAHRPGDPALTRPLIALAAMPDATAWIKVQTAAFRMLEATGDPRAIAALAPLLERADLRPAATTPMLTSLRRVRRVAAALAARFPAGVPPLDPACAELCAELDRELAEPRTYELARVAVDEARLAELLAAVQRDPQDDERRRVYADALQVAGDPRGELIVAQLTPTPTAARRAASIIKRHRRALLGPLATAIVPGSEELARGFLVACSVRLDRRTLAGALLDRPEWATVERLRMVGSSGWPTPAMRSIVELHGVSASDRGLAGLLAGERYPRLEVLGLSGSLTHVEFRGLAQVRGLPRLRELHVDLFSRRGEPPAALLEEPLGRQLDTLHVRFQRPPPLADWLAAMRALPRLRCVVIGDTVASATLALAGDRLHVTVRPGTSPSIRHRVAERLQDLRDQVAAIPGAVLEVREVLENDRADRGIESA